MWDVFISHAWEDKDEIARPLANALAKAGYKVWFDEFTLTVGDSLRRSIDVGLSKSKFGIVILSPNFFTKEWTQRELDGLTAREISSGKIILPVWHKVTRKDIEKFSPVLADRLSVSSSDGLDVVIQEILRVLNQKSDSTTLPISTKIPKKLDSLRKNWWIIALAFSVFVVFGIAIQFLGPLVDLATPFPTTSIASTPQVQSEISSLSPPTSSSSPTATSFPTDTVDARQVSIAILVGGLYPNRPVGYINLDGVGPEEIVITDTDNASMKYYISVFAYLENDKEWSQVLYLRDEMACPYKFDFLNLKKDNSRQLLIYQECGTGSFVYLEIYEYRGFKYSNLLYKLPDPINGLVEVVNQEAYITSYLYNKLYYLEWNGERVNIQETTFQLPTSTKEVHFWREGDELVFSENYIELDIGQLVHFIHNVEKDTDFCGADIRADSSYLDFTEYPNVLSAKISGYTSVSVDCKFQFGGEAVNVKIK